LSWKSCIAIVVVLREYSIPLNAIVVIILECITQKIRAFPTRIHSLHEPIREDIATTTTTAVVAVSSTKVSTHSAHTLNRIIVIVVECWTNEIIVIQ